MNVTLRDIAERAQVSTSTVSRVLNNYPHVNDDVRSSVLRAAEDLGYRLENLRRAVPVARSVLLVGGDFPARPGGGSFIGREFTRLVAAGAQAVLERHGLLTRMQGDSLDDPGARRPPEPGLAGVILLGGNLEHRERALELRAAGVPTVIAGGHAQAYGVNSVTADYLRGLEQAVGHLANLGRRRIGLVNGPDLTVTSEQKYKGFRLALALRDLPFAPSEVAAGDFDSAEGYARTLDLLARAPDLDGLVYADDYMALGGLRALKERGRRVPDDVAVVGFHDYEIAGFTDPPLTTVRFDMRLMGSIAARRVRMLEIEPDAEDWHVLLPTELVVRASA